MTTIVLCVFVLGYLAIALEHKLNINKAASALLIGVICWALYVLNLEQLLPSGIIPKWFTDGANAEHIENIGQRFVIESQHLQLTGEIAGILFS